MYSPLPDNATYYDPEPEDTPEEQAEDFYHWLMTSEEAKAQAELAKMEWPEYATEQPENRIHF